MELAGTGVTVNALLPGPTRTANTEKMRAERAKAAGKTVAELEEEFFKVFRPTSIIKRFTSAEEVANLAVYLCSPKHPPPPAPRCASTAVSSIRSCSLHQETAMAAQQTNKLKIAVIPGDGIGNEVVPEGIRVLEAVGSRFGLDYAWDTSTGRASASPRPAP